MTACFYGLHLCDFFFDLALTTRHLEHSEKAMNNNFIDPDQDLFKSKTFDTVKQNLYFSSRILVLMEMLQSTWFHH